MLVLLAIFCLTGAVSARETPAFAPALLRVNHLSLDERFPEGHALADSLIAAEPDRPEPFFYKAVLYWRQGMNARNGDQYDPEFLRHIEFCIERAEAYIRRHGESAHMFLVLGNAYGIRTGLRMLRRDVVQGILDGFQGREYLFEAREMDPDLVDPIFGIALSDYMLSQKPSVLRMVTRLFSLPSGDREGGLAGLRHVIDAGRFSRPDARSALAYITLYYERDRLAALDRFNALHRTYPNSLDYRIRLNDTRITLVMEHGHDAAGALVDSTRSILAMAAERDITLFPWRIIKLSFIQGMGHFLQGDHTRAMPRLAYVAAQSKVEDNWLLGPTEVTIGKMMDMQGKREDAKRYYRQAERREDVWGSRKEARLLQVKPYDGTEPETRPKDDAQRYPERP